MSIIEDSLAGQLARSIKGRRDRFGLTLRELAEKSGVSASMISDVERGTKSPTLATLAALAVALKTPLSDLLEDEKPTAARIHVLRAADSPPIADRRSGVRRQGLIPKPTAGKVEFARYVVPAGKSAGPFAAHPAGTVEYVHLEVGRIGFVLGTSTVTLGAGDSCWCIADAPHSFDNRNGKIAARLYVIVEPP
jgi:transcriptional regulator with XRE-family HTH domain